MPYDPDKHHRRSIRLPGYDYSSAGLYFLTLCCYQRQHLFGDIIDGTMHLNALGQIVAEEWLKTPFIRPNFALDAWVVMPNHLHGIIIIHNSPVRAHSSAPQPPGPQSPVRAHSSAPQPQSPVRAHSSAPQPPQSIQRPAQSIPSFVAGFKAAATKRINLHRRAPGTPVWQRNYYEHIIRNELALEGIQGYIHNNPRTWPQDSLNSIHQVSETS